MEYSRNVQITKGTVNGPFFCSRLSYLKLGLTDISPQKSKEFHGRAQAKSKERRDCIPSKEQRAVCDRKAKSNEIDLHGKTLTKI